MNPPAAIQNAMGRERKPFTYTPGGLDLSEIKSERMARRLMRNAMSQGVADPPSPSVQSPTTPSTPGFPTPNFYNLPVQVFPAFKLPANPKALLRTRSIPYKPRENSMDRIVNGNNLNGGIAEEFQNENNPLHRRNSNNIASHNHNFNISLVIAPVSEHQKQTDELLATWHPEQPWVEITEERLTPNIVLEPCLKMPSEIISQKKTEEKAKAIQKESASEESVDVETTVTITKPKKTISTSVEIERKLLPDGTVEETKTTTTNTVINEKIESSKVQKETRILSEEEAKEVIQEESEEEEEEIQEQQENVRKENTTVKINGHQEVNKTTSQSYSENVCKTTTVAASKETDSKAEKSEEIVEEVETEEEIEEEEEEIVEETVVEETVIESEPEVVNIVENNTKHTAISKTEKNESVISNTNENEFNNKQKDESEVIDENQSVTKTHSEKTKESEDVIEITTHESEEEDEDEYEEVEEEEEEEVVEEKVETKVEKQDDEHSELKTEVSKPDNQEIKEVIETTTHETKIEPSKQSIEIQVHQSVNNKETVQKKTSFTETETENPTSNSLPETQTTTKKETTEIYSTEIPFDRPMSTQTEIHHTENIITVNKTSKVLDNSYEQITQQGVPTLKAYFPPSRERVPTSPQPAKAYSPIYPITPEKTEERRHSLLLERLSTERQFAPPESYHNATNQTFVQNYENNTSQYQEPQSEVIVSSNIKPSSLKTNSQWYQNSQQQTSQVQSNQHNSNVIYNNLQPTTLPNSSAPTSQPSWTQPSYDSVPQSSAIHQHSESVSYSPVHKPSNWGSNNLGHLDRIPSINAQSNQYSFLSNQKSTESYTNMYNTQYQQPADTNQYNKQTQQTINNQCSTGYVPPPWETEKTNYQPSPFYEPQTAPVNSSTAPPIWNSAAPQLTPKKSVPLSYIPPAPNASFVKQASPAPIPQASGRKTYYSEYERRYISVPEATYIPTETKVQPQWDASPQYYYDNTESSEKIEPSWRKELREFTEKTTKEETTVVQPPWKDEITFPKETTASYLNQPSWSQTLRPRSWMEKSYQSESVHQSQEWPRAQNKRPLSAYVRNRGESPKVDRARGVSVDRYNSTSYQSPHSYSNTPQIKTYAPSNDNNYSFSWETQEEITTTNQNNETQTINSAAKGYHNPHVPAYHVCSNESRDYQVSYSPRWSGQGRDRPVQSRSFKYLQMLTGTEDGDQEPEPFVVQQPHHAVPKPRRV